MFSKRFNLLLIITLILLLGGVSIAQAAPPWQAPGDGSTLGETLNFDNVKPNLGSIMSDQDDTVEPPDGTIEPPDGTVEPPDGTVEPPDGTVEPPDGTEEPTQQHPVASALADYFGVSYDEVMGLHESGYGFGNIAKAYFFADKLGMTPQELLEAAHGSGWGNILKEAGVHKNGKPEHAGKPEKDGAPGQNKKGNDNGPELTGQSEGKDNGNGNGQGGGKGKDKEKGGKGNGKGPKNK